MPKLRERTGYPSAVRGPVLGSTIATLPSMPEIPQKRLRNEIGEILRRAEAGEEFTITVSGRPVARLGPLSDTRQWVPAARLEDLWKLPVDENLADDLKEFDIQLRDPWADQE
jgi:prevent-host-death family protein